MSLTDVVKAIFLARDADKDGRLDKTETQPLFDKLLAKRPELGLEASKYDEWFAAIDHNGNGTIDEAECLAYLESIHWTVEESQE